MIKGSFRQQQLADPARALGVGFQDKTFPLRGEERGLVLYIRADNLSDFASQLICQIEKIPYDQNEEGIQVT